MDDDSENKKAKGTKKWIIKWRLKHNDYKDCLFKNKIILKSQWRFKNKAHNEYSKVKHTLYIPKKSIRSH